MFKILKKSKKSAARVGIFSTPHGNIHTPVFMPVGTAGTVKAIDPATLETLGAQVILGNTYHLALRPGSALISQLGGLHSFMHWPRPILTDSGGFQVFSLSKLRKVDADGVTFQSHLDGSRLRFTPESVVDTQLALNSDIQMTLDVCTPYGASLAQTEKDLTITFDWAKRAKSHWEKMGSGQHLFAIVQGGFFKELRERSAVEMASLNLPGYAVGGLSVGESKAELHDWIDFCAPLLPESTPRYLMGVGLPENLVHGIAAGFDMFDCVAPTRLARHGQFMTSEGRFNIQTKPFESDTRPLDPTCGCSTCSRFSRAYIRHLFRAKELLGMMLMSTHNVHFVVSLVDRIREGILAE